MGIQECKNGLIQGYVLICLITSKSEKGEKAYNHLNICQRLMIKSKHIPI